MLNKFTVNLTVPWGLSPVHYVRFEVFDGGDYEDVTQRRTASSEMLRRVDLVRTDDSD
jgi:hypothetical protein